MPSPKRPSRKRRPFFWLLEKEWRELLVSRAWWALLLAIGPLVGFSFIGAMRTYAELSGLNGGAAGVGEAMAPLIGVWGPTFSACELAAIFLLPFVAIRVMAGDRQSGALKLELQHNMPAIVRIAAKMLALLAGWLIAMLAPLIALALWKSYGGTLYPPELAVLMAGHLLNAGLSIALAAAASSLTEHPSTAAIVTLGVTVGAWILDFVAAVQGGWWEKAAGYTPSAVVAQFQHGLVQLDVTLIALLLIAFGAGVAAIWVRLGVPVRRRVFESLGLAVAMALAIFTCSFTTPSWDASENRANSFPEPDQRALRQIHRPLKIVVHLAQEDPRRVDLERNALSKLRRAMPEVQVQYVALTSTGLFEQTSPNYGEIWFELAGKRITDRAVTAEAILESIYSVAGLTPPQDKDDETFRGHPLAIAPKGAGAIFYFVWPFTVLVSGLLVRRRFV